MHCSVFFVESEGEREVRFGLAAGTSETIFLHELLVHEEVDLLLEVFSHLVHLLLEGCLAFERLFQLVSEGLVFVFEPFDVFDDF